MNTEFLTSLECIENEPSMARFMRKASRVSTYTNPLPPAKKSHIDLYVTGSQLTDEMGNEYWIGPGAELTGFGDLDGPSLRIGRDDWSVNVNEKQFRDFVENVRIKPTFWIPEWINSKEFQMIGLEPRR